MHPDPTNLLDKMEMKIPLIGFYDTPDIVPFEPLVEPRPRQRACLFAFYRQWIEGKTLHMTKDNIGCPGARHWLFDQETRSREDFVRFLADEEGLKASHVLMNQWLDHTHPYHPTHTHLLVGPLRDDQHEYLKSVTFFVNPDQLSLLLLGAQYHSAPDDPTPAIAPFGSGCMQLISLFDDLDAPQAIIGATDIAMRRHIEPDMLAFTTTISMYERLCTLDKKSFLGKRFWRSLQEARRGTA